MKNIIKSIIFILILFLMLIGISCFLVNKKVIGKNKISIRGIIGEKVNSLDYLVLGDSESYTSIIPLEIWNKYGYTGYVLGTSLQRLKESKEILVNNLVNQQPKLLILETNAIFRKNTSIKSPSIFASIFVDIYRYHDNWKFFVNENILELRNNEKGYIYSNLIKKTADKNYKNETTERKSIPNENISYLEKIIEICNRENIQILLISTPSPKNWSYKSHNSIKDLAEKYNLKYLDLNLDPNTNIDWDIDTQDEGDHLNYYGALKVSDSLGKYLYDLNLLEDHRNDEYYSYWNSNYDIYKQKLNIE